jgi:glucan biosynthesis protein C
LLGILTAAVSILLATEPFRGGTNPYAIYYSFAQGFQSVAFSIVSLVFFYRVANQSPWWAGYPARAAYGTFFIHALVLVAIAIAIKPLVMAPMLKFLVLSVLAVPASFVFGYWLARLPLLRRVF